ncbi:MAG: CDP-diacylglycerol--glycerol-3-phosphate 3-phosphatidyltransferase [Clostridia bacterium]|nr:CDP-diacylglycerol--glycerol-3-phosphate 3-phosphatidyltransferase [Clostridia bacterium]
MNLPNKITVCRICLIPLFVFFYMADFVPYGKLIAAILFAGACFTDFLDGKIARKRGLVTNLGKFLDPIADKVLVMAGIILLIACPIQPHNGVTFLSAIQPYYVGIIAAVVILARELIISAFRQVAATKNVVLAADMYGKVKAVFQFITLIFYFVYAFLIEEFYDGVTPGKIDFGFATMSGWDVANTILGLVGYLLLAITVVMTIVSACKYISNNRQVLKDSQK